MNNIVENLIANLNDEQKKAVEHDNGPLLIVAGAGTGKTTVLINRLAYLVLEKNIPIENILIATFTEKAASEMTERADKIMPYGYTNLWINTFHSLCERILRDHGLEIGLPTDFKLVSQTEQWILIKKNIDLFNLDYYKPLGNPNKFIQELTKHFSRLKDENIKSQNYLDYAESLSLDKDKTAPEELDEKKINELANAYHVYNKLLLDNKLLDFGDLICYTLKLFQDRPNILNYYREKFNYIMIDEFQDTNWSQYELIKLLAAPKNNLVAVGDDDQSIYKFRGASISNIMLFKDDYPDAKEIVLNKNYRSGQEILDKSYAFINKNNPNRLEIKLDINKKLISPLNKVGKVEHLIFETESEETETTAKMIKELYEKDKETNWSDFAILARSNETAEKFTKELARENIPNIFISLKGLYYKTIILDCLAYFHLLDNYHESSALFRVLNMETFKVSHEDIININKFGRKKLWSLFESLKNINAIPNISPESVVNINKLMNMVNRHSELAKKEKTSSILINFVYDALEKNLDRDRDVEQYNYLNQFYKKIKTFEEAEVDSRLKDFLELIDLEMDAGETGNLKLNYEDSDSVRVMTVHAAKGLEFKYVFLVNIVDKKFPTINRGELIPLPDELIKEVIPEGNIHLEEERRLFYVAMTRAKEILFITSAKDYGGATEKKPSIFITEAELNSDKKQLISKKSNELTRDIDFINKNNDQKINVYKLPEKFSFSQIEAYNNCPLQYKFAHILKIPTEDKSTAIFGRMMHNVLKDFLTPLLDDSMKQANLFGTKKIDDKKISEDYLLKLFKDTWNDYGYKDKKEALDYKAKGLKMLKNFFENFKNNLPRVSFLEKNFTLKIKDYTLKGVIDRIDRLPDGRFEIIDYKTGTPKEKLTYQDKKQLLIYQIALQELFLENNSKLSPLLSFYYLENGEKISFEAKDKDLEKIQTDIIETIKKIKQMDFTANPGFLCDFCDFNKICEFRK